MSEEIIGAAEATDVYDYILFFTSNRIIGAFKPPHRYPDSAPIIEAIGLYIAEKKREKKIEKLKHLSPEDILKTSEWTFSIPYSIIEKVEMRWEKERGFIKVGWGTRMDIRFKEKYKTQVLVPVYAKFGWIPWKRLKLTSTSQFSISIVKPGFDESVNLVRSVLADKLSVS